MTVTKQTLKTPVRIGLIHVQSAYHFMTINDNDNDNNDGNKRWAKANPLENRDLKFFLTIHTHDFVIGVRKN